MGIMTKAFMDEFSRDILAHAEDIGINDVV